MIGLPPGVWSFPIHKTLPNTLTISRKVARITLGDLFACHVLPAS
jgi:hypothetical protein